mmetsp:Transcript_24589/g.82539  ORF Transcript_24589/g.82539 Transcript_24589/m.82539 type:complete len:218 (+) Transcript_24589:1508-2161(+)
MSTACIMTEHEPQTRLARATEYTLGPVVGGLGGRGSRSRAETMLAPDSDPEREPSWPGAAPAGGSAADGAGASWNWVAASTSTGPVPSGSSAPSMPRVVVSTTSPDETTAGSRAPPAVSVTPIAATAGAVGRFSWAQRMRLPPPRRPIVASFHALSPYPPVGARRGCRLDRPARGPGAGARAFAKPLGAPVRWTWRSRPGRRLRVKGTGKVESGSAR